VTTASIGCPLCGAWEHTADEHDLPACDWLVSMSGRLATCQVRRFHSHDNEPEADQ
jgi:hypothetical protein